MESNGGARAARRSASRRIEAEQVFRCVDVDRRAVHRHPDDAIGIALEERLRTAVTAKLDEIAETRGWEDRGCAKRRAVLCSDDVIRLAPPVHREPTQIFGRHGCLVRQNEHDATARSRQARDAGANRAGHSFTPVPIDNDGRAPESIALAIVAEIHAFIHGSEGGPFTGNTG